MMKTTVVNPENTKQDKKGQQHFQGQIHFKRKFSKIQI